LEFDNLYENRYTERDTKSLHLRQVYKKAVNETVRITEEMKKMKHVGYAVRFVWIFSLILVVCSLGKLTAARAEILKKNGKMQTAASRQIASEPATAAAVEGAMQTQAPSEEQSQPVKVSRLKKVSHVKLIRFSTHKVKVEWKKQKKARYYRVYYSSQKKGRYTLAGITKKTHFLVKHLKKNKKYYFYVQACRKRQAALSDSKPSRIKSMKMKKYRRKIVFAGDSICEGIGYGWAYPQMHSSAKKKTVAYRGLNTITYHTKRVFGGKTGLQKLIAEKPYRVYMMLGLNEIHARKASLVLAEYKSLIESFHQACPDTDIVLCSISPVSRAERASHPGMGQIPAFNKKLKKLALKKGFRYLDYTDFLKDSQGYLKSQYAAKDGYHWKPSAYVKFGRIVGKFDRSLDR
jgi:lysophospholipase L1-like esterase